MNDTLTGATILVRPYRHGDLPGIQEIFFGTAYNGRPSINFFDDGFWLAEAMLHPYLRFEPDLCLIAECEGRIVAYVTGTCDSAAYQRIWIKRILPRLLFLFFRRGVCFQMRAWHFLIYGARSFLRGEMKFPTGLFKQYPAHLHVNVRDSHQGKGIGHKLVTEFLSKLKEISIPGVHARTSRSDGRHPFFEKLGFNVICSHALSLWEYLENRPYQLITYAFLLGEQKLPMGEPHHA